MNMRDLESLIQKGKGKGKMQTMEGRNKLKTKKSGHMNK